MRGYLVHFAAILLAMLQPVRAQDLAILTSFPEQFSAGFVQIFAPGSPGNADGHDTASDTGGAQAASDSKGGPSGDPERGIRVLNKNTVAALDEILRGNPRGFKIFWSSSPEAFEILRRENAFAAADICGAGGPPSVAPFAISAVGWARRRDAEVFMPGEWNDLLDPSYNGKIAMARPSRSGTTHLMIEEILQVRGWNPGWAYFLELAGNLSTLTARSFGVPEGLIDRRFDIGFTIDFLAQSRAELLDFRYGRPLVLAPAQIGILKEVGDPAQACAFVRLILSPQGQRMLVQPDIGRVPYDAAIREEVRNQLPDGIIQALRLPWLDYDARASADRFWAVNTLFDLTITEVLTERRDLWRRYHALRGRVAPERLNRVRRILTTVPVSWDEARDASLRIAGGMRGTALVTLGTAEREIVADWRARVATQLSAAERALVALERPGGR